ncbi:claudin-23-like [Latimeria chalumnae]|uniref:claudin-23-like n=1 Tax=Latimeria chalumnae TaxID=7897 RepID=UPI0003C19B2D|nr:PREDICTED: claudin-23-like [Latimeria chalumnae]|eukprot:XP_006014618.1 PREDICTED: claudin-23-like [Latimeria chalumnae]
MRTPAVMVIGIVLAPCGLIFLITTTAAPAWKDVRKYESAAEDEVRQQGIWDICEESESTHSRQCGLTDTDYFKAQVVRVARGMMIASLAVTALGIGLASLGIRCWDEDPNYLLSGLSGLVIFAAGVLSIIPLSWYTNNINDVPTATQSSDMRVGYAVALGFIGSCFELMGGFSLVLSFFHFCKKKDPASNYYANRSNKHDNKTPAPQSHTNPLEVTDGPSYLPKSSPFDADL